MKRGPFAVAAAAAGFVGAVGLHASGSTTALTAILGTPTSGRNTAGTTTPSTSKGHSNPPSSTSNSGSITTTPTHAVTTTKGVSSRSATGSTYQYGYGQLGVRVTVTGTKITGLSVVGLQTAESYSQQIAAQVIPMLRQEVLAAQSVHVNGISGATYTADAYVSSIQSALNKLRFK